MEKQSPRTLTALLVALGVLSVAVPCSAGEGFGTFTKKAATLERVTPPKVYLFGTRINVKVSAQDSNQTATAQSVQSQLESELLRNDNRLASDAVRPDTLIEITLLPSQYHEQWETRRVTQVGQYIDDKGRKTFGPYQADARFKVVSLSFAATYKVTDVKARRSLAADSINADYKESFQEGKEMPDQTGVENAAVGKLVARLAGDLTPTRERIKVLLPQGSLEDAGRLAEAGLWNKYLETLESLPEKKSSADEAYRKYALGVAYEAVGYAAEDSDTTLKYLEQASTYYNQALEMNPKERLFAQAYESVWTGTRATAPLERVRAALVGYRKQKEFKESYAQAKSAAAAPSTAGAKALSGGASDDGAMNNAAVIKMAEAGLGDDIILTSINSAPKTAFDVSPEGLIALSEARVSKTIIARIQELAHKGSPPAAKAGKKRQGSKPKTPPDGN